MIVDTANIVPPVPNTSTNACTHTKNDENHYDHPGEGEKEREREREQKLM